MFALIKMILNPSVEERGHRLALLALGSLLLGLGAVLLDKC